MKRNIGFASHFALDSAGNSSGSCRSDGASPSRTLLVLIVNLRLSHQTAEAQLPNPAAGTALP